MNESTDLVIVIDTSASLTANGFEAVHLRKIIKLLKYAYQMRRFLLSFIRGMTISKDGTHVSLVLFSHNVNVLLPFESRPHTKDELLSAVGSMEYRRGKGTDIAQ